MKTYDLMIADDSKRARQAIRMILESEPQFQIVAEAANGMNAIQLAKELTPDLILMDINMPELNGLQATWRIKRELPHVHVVILSVSDDPADLFEAIRSGAQGYLVKRLDPKEWVPYLLGIMDGKTPISRNMAERLLAEFMGSKIERPEEDEAISSLTVRESEILGLVRLGATNREIAKKLFISENTVKNHLKNIMAKLHFKNRVQLATMAGVQAQLRTPALSKNSTH